MSSLDLKRSEMSVTSTDVTDVQAIASLGDTRGPIRLGFLVLVMGFGSLLLWAAFAPLDEGVSASATVAIETRRKTIQHLSGGVVKRVAVKEGQMVKEGDILVELDEAVAQANFESIRQNYMAQRAAESRLLAEQQERPSIDFHPDLIAAASDPLVQTHIATQNQLFAAKRAALNSEISVSQEVIAGHMAQLSGFQAMLQSRRAQLNLQDEQLKNVAELAREGYAPRNQALQLEQAQADLRTSMAELLASIERSKLAITEQRMRMTQRRHEYNKEAGAQLADLRREVQAGQDKLKAITGELGRVQIKSPVDGQVVGLALSSGGGVVTPGQKLMDVVPEGAALLVDAKIPVHVIDRVKKGDEAQVRFSGFAQSPQLVLDATVVSLSGDAVTEAQGLQSLTYYLARVQVSEMGLKQLGKRVMQPGMPAEVLVKTGERSLLTYLLHPLTKRIAASMKEE